jgi:hypothetical protein
MKRKIKSLIQDYTDLIYERNELREIVDEMSDFMHKSGIAFS